MQLTENKNYQNEIWKDIEGFEGLYQVSNFGRVKSLPRIIKFRNSTKSESGKILKIGYSTKGYCQVYLSKDGIKKTLPVHRLVAIAFIPNPENKPQANHKTGDKSINYEWELEWNDNSENQIHAFKHGLNKITQKHKAAAIKNGLRKRRLSPEDIFEIKQMRLAGSTYREISEKFKISGKFAELIIKNKKYKDTPDPIPPTAIPAENKSNQLQLF